MLSVEDARRAVLDACAPLPARRTAMADALGLVLAEEVRADRDVPPLDRSIMDGYAVRSADLPSGKGTLRVVEEVTAGRVPQRALGPGEATRIMTGAAIPDGADAVVMVERTRADGDRVTIDDTPPAPGQFVLRRGQEMRAGDVLLEPGAVLRPQEVGMLATVGHTAVEAVPRPRVAVAATGDELVDAAQTPGPGQVRNSNAPMLVAQAARAGGVPRNLGVGRDDLAALRALIDEGLRSAEVLILSGGVSEGARDLVPGALAEAGVVAHFHKVRMKPGKPLLFGSAEGREGRRLVFGLPGNPVSSLVCFELFIRPALRRLAGFSEPDLDLPVVRAGLEEAARFSNNRPTYHPARLTLNGAGFTARPVPWFGSADLRAFARANALLRLPAGEVSYAAGEAVDAVRLDG